MDACRDRDRRRSRTGTQLTFRMWAQCREHFFQGVRGVGVIDHHQRTRATAQTLHPAGRAFQLRQHFQNFVQRVVEPQQSTDRSQYIAQVETTQQAAAQDDDSPCGVTRVARTPSSSNCASRQIQISAAVFLAVGNQTRIALVAAASWRPNASSRLTTRQRRSFQANSLALAAA